MNLKTVLIVSHDAGGANILALWCRQWKQKLNFVFKLSGPAVTIFNNEIPDLVNISTYPETGSIQGVITSTGWQSNAEFEAIEWAKVHHIPVASYIDHWVNFKTRFERRNLFVLPDEIWVADQEAMNIATKEFSNFTVSFRYIKNRYFTRLKRAVSRSDITSDSLLICLEPIRDNITFDDVYSNLANYLAGSIYKNMKLVIRDHPSSVDTGLTILLDKLKKDFNITISNNELSRDLSRAAAVVAYQSSVLIYASYLGIEAISFFPVKKMEPILPHKVIQYI